MDKNVIEDLQDYEKFQKYLGNERYYHDYLLFFHSEIEKKGYQTVIHDYCLKRDERAIDMLVRLHAGKLHESRDFWRPMVNNLDRIPPPDHSFGVRCRVQAACDRRRSPCSSSGAR